MNSSNTVAKQSSTATSRFVLVEKGMGLKEKKISFKVNNLANWVGIGVCMKNKITAIDYAFKCMFSLTKINSWDTEAIFYRIMDILGLIVLLKTIFIPVCLLLRMDR